MFISRLVSTVGHRPAQSLYKESLKLAKTTIYENEIVETQTECQTYQLGLFTLIRVVIMKPSAKSWETILILKNFSECKFLGDTPEAKLERNCVFDFEVS